MIPFPYPESLRYLDPFSAVEHEQRLLDRIAYADLTVAGNTGWYVQGQSQAQWDTYMNVPNVVNVITFSEVSNASWTPPLFSRTYPKPQKDCDHPPHRISQQGEFPNHYGWCVDCGKEWRL